MRVPPFVVSSEIDPTCARDYSQMGLGVFQDAARISPTTLGWAYPFHSL